LLLEKLKISDIGINKSDLLVHSITLFDLKQKTKKPSATKKNIILRKNT